MRGVDEAAIEILTNEAGEIEVVNLDLTSNKSILALIDIIISLSSTSIRSLDKAIFS